MLPGDLNARRLEERDLPVCASLVRGRLAYAEDLVTDLPIVWRRLLREDALTGTFIERGLADGSAAVAGFAASVFVTDSWMTMARSGTQPYLTARTLRQELAGPSPILRGWDIARENDDRGLNVLILHYCEAGDLDEQQRAHFRYRMLETFIELHRGYRIEEVLQEFWDEIDPAFVLSGWGRVRTNYAAYFRSRGQALPPPGRGPCLVGVTRDEALANPGDIAAPLFLHVAPRLLFTRAERELLQHALLGRTDVELARKLGLALPTIKSRWRDIYHRVGRLAPEVITVEVDRRGAARGREKRRRLLEHLRRHPEELNVRNGRGRAAPGPHRNLT